MKTRSLRSRSCQLSVFSCQPKFICILVGIASSVLVASAAAGASGRQAAAVAAQDEEELARIGHEMTEKVCVECHEVEVVTSLRRTPRDWNNMVTTMAQRGANGTDDQFATIKKYLTRYYGLLAVNSAAAEDFGAVLGLSAKDADAIVEYRKANGKFADAAALGKVPGIDKSKMEAQLDALLFN